MSDLVLIVDANKPERSRIKAALEAAGRVEVRDTGDIESARAILANESIDVLIVDLVAHGGNGWLLAIESLANQEDLIVFAMSVQIDLKLGREMLKRGVREIFFKALGHETAARKVKAALRAKARKTTTA